jgi:hypothetical protein
VSPGSEYLLVFREGAIWHWSYQQAAVDGSPGASLASSVPFVDAQEARHAASTAYPGLPVFVDASGDADGVVRQVASRAARWSRPARLLVVAVVFVGAVLALRRTRFELRVSPVVAGYRITMERSPRRERTAAEQKRCRPGGGG